MGEKNVVLPDDFDTLLRSEMSSRLAMLWQPSKVWVILQPWRIRSGWQKSPPRSRNCPPKEHRLPG